MLNCSDGDLACDLDGARDGRCTFGVAVCFANADPRYPRCTPSTVKRMELLQPKAGRRMSPDTLANVSQFENALSALGLEVRRRGHVIAEGAAPVGNDVCSPLIRLVMPAPKKSGARAIRRKFQLRARSEDRRADTDRFILVCE